MDNTKYKIIKMGKILLTQSMNKCNNNHINKYVKLNNNEGINTYTGEIISYSHALSKYDCLTTIRSTMKKNREKILYNTYDKLGNVYYVTFMLNKACSYNELLKKEKHLKDGLTYRYPNIKYAIFEQSTKSNIYHLHCIFWNDNNQPLDLTQKELEKIWNQNTLVDISCLNNEEELIKCLYYLTNYRIDENSKNYQKQRNKIESLKNFPPGCKLCKTSRNLKKPIIEIVENYENNNESYMEADSFGKKYRTYVA